MKFLVEKNKNSEHRVTINISKTIIQKKIIKQLSEIRKSESINGFRKGKIPINIVQKKYGDKIYYDVFNSLMQKFFYEFIKKENINIIGSPRYYIHPNKNNNNIKDFKYSVTYALNPIFEVKDLELITAKKIKSIINKQDILQKIEKNFNIWTISRRPTKIHDRVLISYQIYINNQMIKNFHETCSLIISKKNIISQLYFKIINKCTNDIFFFKMKFSQFHPEKILRNQNTIIKIKIVNIEEKENKKIVLPKNQEIKENNISKALYDETKKNINKKIKKISDNYLYHQIIEQLIKANPIAIPTLLIEEEIKNLFYNNIERYKKNNGNILDKKYHINIEYQAKKNVHITLIFKNIISSKKLLPNANSIDQLIKKIALNYKKPSEIINLYNTNKNLIEKIRNIELEMQVMQLLLKKIKITKEYYTLDEAIHYTKKRINNDLYYNA